MSKITTWTALLAAFACGNALAISNPDGLLTASSAADLDAAAEDGNLVFGRGMLKWTGGDAVWTGGVTLAMPDNTELTVNVTDPNATLTINGATEQAGNGQFLKTGPGTLELTGGGRLGKGTVWGSGYWMTHGKPTEPDIVGYVPYWDDTTGYATNGGYTGFTVMEGTLRLNAPGQAFTLAVLPWVGDRQQTSSVLEITNNTTVTTDGGWFSTARGTGQTSNDASSTVRVTDGGSFSVHGFCMGNANSTPNYYAHARVELDNGTMTVNNQIFQPESSGSAVISLTNRSSFTHTWAGEVTKGWDMRSAAATVVAGCSTVATHQVGMEAGVALDVTDGGVFKLNQTTPSYYRSSGVRSKRVRFDGGTLMPYTDGALTEWFGGAGAGVTNFVVGANGMTVDVPAWSWLGAVPRAESAASKIVKVGAGTLSLPTNAVPVELREGRLAFDRPMRTWTNGVDETVSLAPGTGLYVAGEGALGGRTIAPADGASLAFGAAGRRRAEDAQWTCNQWARLMPDGDALMLTVPHVHSHGSAWRTQKVRVDESFTVSFDYFAHASGTATPDWCVMLAFQSDSASACGGNGGNLAINNGTISNCWTIGVQVKDCNIPCTIARISERVYNINVLSLGNVRAALMGSPDAPTRCTLAYDAEAKRAVFTVSSGVTGDVFTRTENVDLVEWLGDTTAWVGFTGSTTQDASTQHVVRNFRHVPAAPAAPARVRTGGNLQLAAGGTLAATLAGNDAVSTFALDSLTASGTATLDVSSFGAGEQVGVVPVLSTRDHDLWTLEGNAFWTETGLAASTNASGANGGAVTKHAYPVAGSWNLAFDWSPGSPVPAHIADWYTVSIGSFSTAPTAQNGAAKGITLYLQDWDNSITREVVYVRLYVNGAAHATQYYSTNAAETVKLDMKKDLHVNMVYDDDAKRIVLDLTQDGGATAKQLVFDGVDMDAVLSFAKNAHLGVFSRVGGYQTQAIMSNLAWTGAAMTAATTGAKHRSALAFDRIDGLASLVKTGDADLAFLKPDGLPTAVTLAKGGLRFAKEPLETVTVGEGGGWIFSADTGVYTATNGIKIGTNVSNNRDSANLRHRVRVTGDWKTSFRLWNTIGADAISFYLHNDPRGCNVVGGNNTSAGYQGVQNAFAVGWFTYSDKRGLDNKMGLGQNSGAISYDVLMDPVNIRTAKPIDVMIVHTAAAKTLDVTMVQDGNTFTHQWTDVDVPGSIGGDYAYLAVGSGGGGVHTYPYYDNFTFEQLDGADTLAEGKYLSSIDVTARNGYVTLDSPVADGAFAVADGVSVAAGSTLRVVAANEPATLRTGTLTLGAGASLAGDAGATIAPDAVAGDFTDLVVDGAVFAPSEADITAGTFAKRTVRLSNGAKLHIGAAKFMRVEDVYVDGVRQDTASVYTALNADWITSTSIGRVGMRAGTVLILR